MSEPLLVQIQAALCAYLKTPELNSPPTPIAMPLVAYVPKAGVAYFDVHPLLVAQTQHPSLGFTDSNLERGIFQVDAVVPDNGKGEAPGRRLAALVVARFALGTKLALDSQYLRINSPPQVAPAIKDDSWVRFPVSIPYLVID